MTIAMTLSYDTSSPQTNLFLGTGLTPLIISSCKPLASRFALITDDQVKGHHGEKILAQMRNSGLNAELFSFPAGEASKTRKTKELLEDELFAKGFGKDSLILALGGGVVLDIVGFIAATYARGVPLILLPSTLLAMADASIGGKNGIDLEGGKNMIGTIYPPHAIFDDIEILQTLPEDEMRNGCAEIIKHGLIDSSTLFEKMENAREKMKDTRFVLEILKSSIAVKKKIVEKDPHETGLRRVLNFGHTVGHAIESLESYQISHGEAIVLGMIVEAEMSRRKGHLKKAELERIIQLFKHFKFPLKFSANISAEKLWILMQTDKKAARSIPRIVLLQTIGQVDPCNGAYCEEIDLESLKQSLTAVKEILHAL